MYFITTDAEGNITQVVDGSRDYIHRVTGEPIKDALQVPDGAIEIGEPCLNLIKQSSGDLNLKWDGSCVVATPLTDPDLLRKKLIRSRLYSVEQDEINRINALTDEEVLSELGEL
jgi:hypothetical protein